MPVWDKAKHSSKAAFDNGWAAFEKLGAPVNKFTNKIGSEAFWPQGLGPESDKAARILKSFCKDGFYKEENTATRSTTTLPAVAGNPAGVILATGLPATGASATNVSNTGTPVVSTSPPTSPGPKGKPKVLVKIPQKVIQNCVGLAIFTVMRTGLWVSGAGGSGVLIARKDDGNWGPPSGILIHTLGVGFMAGIDIYDCVIVINNRKALEAFKTMRVSLGGELSVVAGPLGAGGVLEAELIKNSKKRIFSYVKSRGLYGGLQIDGTIIVERNDENAKFYGERLPISNILAGQVKTIPVQTKMLMEVVKQAEGRTDVDPVVLEQASHVPPPSDLEVEKMSEPNHDQKVSFAPPPNYGSVPVGTNGAGLDDEKTGYGNQQAYGVPTYNQGEPSSYYTGQQNQTAPNYDDHSYFGAQPTGTSQYPPGSSTSPLQNPPSQHTSAAAGSAGSDGFSPYDPTLYEAPTPLPTHDAHPLPLGQNPVIGGTGSGFAPPPGPPPAQGLQRTDSGFPVPPPRSPRRDVQDKQDLDGPPRYA
ncbi:related to protein YSC84 [Rhynchosporium agropyri]|uniref:Related to protein YSC84 n=1 Tax=Rhynchosporium agropyri TaxID=914238 RepID=A0A1E1LP88_9HELO|nr:related to protein YSC84 [Rhynchosporium agropyri]